MATFGPGSVAAGIKNIANLRCCCGCSVCGSTPTVGPDWNAAISGFTDSYSSVLTTAQQNLAAVFSGTPIHGTINGTHVLTGAGPSSLRSYAVGRLETLTRFDTGVAGAAPAFWDEAVSAISGGCTFNDFATSFSSSPFYQVAINESFSIVVFCPEYNRFDTSGTMLEIAVDYYINIEMSWAFISGTQRIQRVYNAGTYLQVLKSSISCPVGLTLDLSTNAVCTNCQSNGFVAGVTSLGSYADCFVSGANLNIPLTGSMLLTS